MEKVVVPLFHFLCPKNVLKYLCFLFCSHIDPFRNITLFKNIFSKDHIFWTEEVLIKNVFFSGFSGFPDQPGPENRVLPSWANPWTKRSPTSVDTSSTRIGSANLSIHTGHYSYLLKILINHIL